MKKFKGTQGKWEINQYHDGDLIGISVESNSGGVTLFDTGACGYIDDKEIANAKLIAAAPEMLGLFIEISESERYTLTLDRKIKELIKKATE